MTSLNGRFSFHAEHVVDHIAPQLLDGAGLLLDGDLHAADVQGDAVGHGVEVDAHCVAVGRLGHGEEDGVGGGRGDLGFHDDLGRTHGQ